MMENIQQILAQCFKNNENIIKRMDNIFERKDRRSVET